jgi:hypothetical protein
MNGMNMVGYPAPQHASPAGATAPAPAAAIAPRATAGGSFTCSMHPSVVANAPGACPYCGMALTRKK